MESEAVALLALAESVADGAPIDWDAAEARAREDERAVMRQLRVLSEVAVLHRTLPSDPRDLPSALIPVRTDLRPAIGAWAHLTLLERIGGGSFGDVYRAWDRHLEREVALKLLKNDDSAGDPQASPVAREGRLLARVRHPNVITVHGVAVHDARVGLWMELIRGVSLEEQLRRQGPFSAREATLLGIDLCRALAAIHAAGLIHRDIKAHNVMREDGGRLVLMDLGAGRDLASDGTQPVSDLTGTPLYLAPEIFDGQQASAQSDIYSLGVLLHHLVTGSYPVRASTVQELQDAHRLGTRTRLRDARADLPTAFVQVIDRATAADREERYGSAGALESALIAALDERPARQMRWGRMAAVAAAVAVAAGLSWAALGRGLWPAAAVAPIRAIAVLPLANLSNDPAQEYFADGMTDELIAVLGQLDGVNVISRTSVMRYKGSGATVPEIARTLGVDAVLEGSVLVLPGDGGSGAPNNRIRINARLIHAGTDLHLWNRTFERSGGDVFALQSEIARAVSEGIDARLGRAPAVRSRPQDFEVFDLYLRGRYYWNMRTEEGLTQSVRYFQAAIDRDPRYAPAHAGLADAYLMLGYYGFLASGETIPRARAAALSALDLDGSLGEVHASLGNIHVFLFEWDAAEASFRRAIELSPGYATAHHWYALYLATQRRFDEAFRHIQTASALDPLSVNVKGAYGIMLLWAGRYGEAIAQLRATLALEPGLARLRASLARALAIRQEYGLALAEAERAVSLAPDDNHLLGDLASILAMSSRRSEAAAMVQDLADRYLRGEYAEPIAIAVIYAALGDNDRAFEWLDRARQHRDPWFGEFKVEVRFDSLRKDPRFAELLREVGLAP